MEQEYAATFSQLNIEQSVFDQIIADEGARGEIYECLMLCFMSVPQLKDIAAALLQYMSEPAAAEVEAEPETEDHADGASYDCGVMSADEYAAALEKITGNVYREEKTLDFSVQSSTIKSKGNFDTNYSLPYGLCAEEGIELPKGATPQDAWDALKQKTGKEPDEYYAERYNKGGSKQKVTHFRTKGSSMEVTYDLEMFKKYGPAKKKTGVLLKGEKITGIYTFAGKGGKNQLRVAADLAKRHPGTKAADWSHKAGYAEIINKHGVVQKREVHWFECEGYGQAGMKVKY